MIDADKLNTLLHYMKGAEHFSYSFEGLTRGSSRWCPFTHRGGGVDCDCYRTHQGVQAILAWTGKYLQCVRFLDVDRYRLDDMSGVLLQLSAPEQIADHAEFRGLLDRMRDGIKFIEPTIVKKLERVACTECVRLDEAAVCFSNYCFTASVAMAVSAVEYRLVELIRRKNERLYRSSFARSTLGQLIQVFDDTQYKDKKYAAIKKLMPQKHKPLLALLNQYRVFSVHPKGETITPQIAESILHLAFAFVLDEAACPYREGALKCGGVLA